MQLATSSLYLKYGSCLAPKILCKSGPDLIYPPKDRRLSRPVLSHRRLFSTGNLHE